MAPLLGLRDDGRCLELLGEVDVCALEHLQSFSQWDHSLVLCRYCTGETSEFMEVLNSDQHQLFYYVSPAMLASSQLH